MIALAAFAAASAALLRADAAPLPLNLLTYPHGFIASRGMTDGLGNSVAAGDLNGDTVDDLVAGARQADPDGRIDAGQVFIVEGPLAFPGSVDLSSSPPDIAVLGSDTGDRMNAVAVGDINGDDVGDLIVGAAYADGPGSGSCSSGTGDRCESGEVYVIYGDGALPATIDLSSAAADVTIHGAQAGDFIGETLTVVDLNDDGYDDAVLGSPSADLPTCVGFCNYGAVYVMFGGAALPATVDLSTTNPGMILRGAASQGKFGQYLAVGDVNGDNLSDLASGPYPLNIMYGSNSLPAELDYAQCVGENTAECPDVELRTSGAPYFTKFTAVTLGDTDDDGDDDIVAAAHTDYLDEGPLFGTEAADLYVIEGERALPSVVTLYTGAVRVRGDVEGSAPQYELELLGADMNSDGAEEIVFSLPGGYGNVLVLEYWYSDAFYQSLAEVKFRPSSDSMAKGDLNADGAQDAVIGVDWGSTGYAYVLPGAQATPINTDGDGCSDQQELGTSQTQGGLRSYLNPWDYFNPTLDGLNRVDDILAAVDAYFMDDADGSPGLPPYAPGYNPATDRTLFGPVVWNLGPPDGLQRVDDILNIVKQYFHDCA